jgi:hypothetical protein
LPLQIHKPKIASEVNSEHRLRLPALRDPIPKDVQELFTVSALDGMPRDCGNMRVEILTRLLCRARDTRLGSMVSWSSPRLYAARAARNPGRERPSFL